MRYQEFVSWVAGLIFTVSLALLAGTVIHFVEAVALAAHSPMDAFGSAAFLFIALAMCAKHILLAILGVNTALNFGAAITQRYRALYMQENNALSIVFFPIDKEAMACCHASTNITKGTNHVDRAL